MRNSPTVTMLRANWFVFFEFLFVRACQCSCLCARVKDTRKRGRVRIAPCLSGFVVCSLLVFLDVMSVLVLTCPFLLPWAQSLHDCTHPYFLSQTGTAHGLQQSLRKKNRVDTSIISAHLVCPVIALSLHADLVSASFINCWTRGTRVPAPVWNVRFKLLSFSCPVWEDRIVVSL